MTEDPETDPMRDFAAELFGRTAEAPDADTEPPEQGNDDMRRFARRLFAAVADD